MSGLTWTLHKTEHAQVIARALASYISQLSQQKNAGPLVTDLDLEIFEASKEEHDIATRLHKDLVSVLDKVIDKKKEG